MRITKRNLFLGLLLSSITLTLFIFLAFNASNIVCDEQTIFLSDITLK